MSFRFSLIFPFASEYDAGTNQSWMVETSLSSMIQKREGELLVNFFHENFGFFRDVSNHFIEFLCRKVYITKEF